MITNKITKNLRKDTIDKLMAYIKTDSYAELSRVLGHKSRQHLDNCLKRGNIPTNRIINYALKEGIDLNWLFGQSKFALFVLSEEHNKTYRKLIDVKHELKED